MSLNLISSLSFLKSRLGGSSQRVMGGGSPATSKAAPARLDLFGSLKTSSTGSVVDLYGGVTESDLESSSSESEEEEDSDPDSSG
jgi:hypothetical protein